MDKTRCCNKYSTATSGASVPYAGNWLAMASSSTSSTFDEDFTLSNNNGPEVIDVDCLTVPPSLSSAQKEKSINALIRKRDELLAAINSSDSDNSDSDSCKVLSNICSTTTSQRQISTSLNFSSSSSDDESNSKADQYYQSNSHTSTEYEEFDASINIRTESSDLHDIMSFLDKNCHSIYPEWSSPLLYPPDEPETAINITRYASRKSTKYLKNKADGKIYFSPNKFPLEGGFNGSGFDLLTKALQRAAVFSGFELVRYGKYPAKNHNLFDCQKFACSKYKKFQKNRKSKTLPCAPERKSSYHNDKLNSRGKDGKKMCRRSTTKRPVHSCHRCKYFFLVHYDSYAFFVVPGIGNVTHSHHPKKGGAKHDLPSRLLEEVNQKFVNDMADGSASESIIRNVLFYKTGYFLSRQNINYIKRNTEEMLDNDNLVKSANMSPTDIIVSKCEKKSYDYMILLQDPVHGIMPISQTFSGSTGSKSEDCLTDLSPNEQQSLQDFVIDGRSALKLEEHHKYMIAFAWVSPSEREKFNLFPEVITVDTLAGTNNETRPLLATGGKDSNGKMFIFLRAYLPNERGWIFRWIFSIVLPKMFSKTVLLRTQLVITDGDLQEYSQLDNAILKFFPHIKRARCGWHIVDRSWDKHFPRKSEFPLETHMHIEKIKKNVHNWMYSWMKPACETIQEYRLSKYLLYKYLLSQPIIQKVSSLMYLSVKMLVKNYIEIHDDKFLFCLRRNVKHFGEYSNVILEGCFGGVKHHSSSPTPSTRLDNSFTIISNNSDMKNSENDKKVSDMFLKQPAMTTMAREMCKTHLTPVAYDTIVSLFEFKNSYKCHRLDASTWFVTKTEQSRNNDKAVIPKFKRVRTVSLSNNKLICSCPHGNVYGLPCSHVMKVASMIPGWVFPTHHDCSVRWWKSYYFYGLSSVSRDFVDRSTIYKCFHLLKQREVDGLTINPALLNELRIDGSVSDTDFLSDSNNPTCYNYSLISYLDIDGVTEYNENIEGMTQLSSIQLDDEFNSIIEDSLNNGSDLQLVDVQKVSPFHYLNPSFKALTSIMEGNCTQEDLFEAEKMLNSLTAKYKEKVTNELGSNVHKKDTIYVSPNPQSSKKWKHHGCRGYR